MTIRLHHYTAANMDNAVTVTIEPTATEWTREYLGVVGVEGECSMTAHTKIDPAVLATWRGTDAELARALGVSREGIRWARQRHSIPAVRRGLPFTRTLQRALISEAKRRGQTIAEVLIDLQAWADGVEG